jgi:beta-xylosidase
MHLQNLAPWVRWGRNWAPSVFVRPNNPSSSRFVMWYTAQQASTGHQCLGVATAASPTGPFVDTSTTPAYCRPGDASTIDANPFVDTDGTPYLAYAAGTPSRLWVAQLTSDGRALVPGTERLLLEGRAPDAALVEAPNLVRVDGQLYLFYSTDDWWTAGYRVGVATCDTPSGPCVRKYRTALLASRGPMVGPGGQTPFQDSTGGWHMMFHAWTSPLVGYPNGARSLRLLPLTFAGGDVRIG